jgi:hypothetical protein
MVEMRNAEVGPESIPTWSGLDEAYFQEGFGSAQINLTYHAENFTMSLG